MTYQDPRGQKDWMGITLRGFLLWLLCFLLFCVGTTVLPFIILRALLGDSTDQ